MAHPPALVLCTIHTDLLATIASDTSCIHTDISTKRWRAHITKYSTYLPIHVFTKTAKTAPVWKTTAPLWKNFITYNIYYRTTGDAFCPEVMCRHSSRGRRFDRRIHQHRQASARRWQLRCRHRHPRACCHYHRRAIRRGRARASAGSVLLPMGGEFYFFPPPFRQYILPDQFSTFHTPSFSRAPSYLTSRMSPPFPPLASRCSRRVPCYFLPPRAHHPPSSQYCGSSEQYCGACCLGGPCWESLSRPSTRRRRSRRWRPRHRRANVDETDVNAGSFMTRQHVVERLKQVRSPRQPTTASSRVFRQCLGRRGRVSRRRRRQLLDKLAYES